ncbi:hypothetical protein N0V90_008378 [Kalmusia sp. IMI 367209]|nr:hypothetical protein N0V90_008378 [Kalmusia sp. IMI 367209]
MPPNETSPLLPKPALQAVSPHSIDADNAIVSEGVNGYHEGDAVVDEEPDGGDIERQVFLAAADQTLIVSTYGTIGTDLHALNSTSWIATGYFLTLTAFQPLYGKLSDVFGRKTCLLFAYVVFAIGSTFCGLARNIGELIVARAIAGIGGGGMTTCVSILFSDVVSLRDRGTWQGYINIIYASGSAAGAPIGGLLADSVGWRWAFMAQGPLCLVAIVAVAAVLHLPQTDNSHWVQKLLKIDFLGAMILIVAVSGVLVGLDRGSNISWSDPYTIAGLCMSPLFIIFILVEHFIASHPFAPFRIILNRSLFACYLCNFFAFGGWLAALFFIPLYWQVIADLHAAQAGLLLIPCIISGVSGSLFGGIYMKKTGKYYWITVIGYSNLVFGLAMILLFAGVIKENIPIMVVGTSITAFSNGIGVTTTLIGLIANAKHKDQAVATACSYLFRSLGSVFGISMCATAFNQTLRKSLEAALSGDKDAKEIAERVRASLSYFRSLEPELKGLVRECYSKSTRAALSVSVGLVIGSAFFAWFIREKRLGK